MPIILSGDRAGHFVRGLLFPFLIVLFAGLAGGCDDKNTYEAPPPAKVTVAHPLRQDVKRYLHATGSTSSRQSVDLVARVAGTLQSIEYRDGEHVTKGRRLFVIDPAEYKAKVDQAEASVAEAKAALDNAEAEFKRQTQLSAKAITSQAKVDDARAQRDSAKAQLASAEASLELARINLGYTTIDAPFDGMVTAHQADEGAYLAQAGSTTLATLVQLKPVNLDFSISETDMLTIRREMRDRGETFKGLGSVPVEAETQIEIGYPHHGTLDYVAPQVDPQTGTLSARAVFANDDLSLLPGMFVRLRIPVADLDAALLVPDSAIGTDQQGRYVLTVDGNDVVHQRVVELATDAALEGFQVVTKGLGPDDLVVVGGLARATPDAKVAPETVTLSLPQDASGRN